MNQRATTVVIMVAIAVYLLGAMVAVFQSEDPKPHLTLALLFTLLLEVRDGRR